MANAKIVIVDDDFDFAKALQITLENANYEVITASSRAEGMEKIRTEKPQLAMLDVMMSTWEDGFEMARELKGEPEFKDMPIMMLTGVKEKTGINFKKTSGDPVWCPVNSFFDKPVDSESLLAEVKKLLECNYA